MKKTTLRKPVFAPQPSVGIDLAADTAVLCKVGRDGKVASTTSIVLTRQELRATFASMEATAILLESCNNSAWVGRELEELGHEVLVCNPRRLKLIAGSTLKTDKLDAEVLGRLARLHQLDPELLHPCTVRSRETQLRRSNLAVRDQLVAMRTGLLNLVRSVLRADALPQPKATAECLVAKLAKLDIPDDVARLIEPVTTVITVLNQQIAAVERKLSEIAKEIPAVQTFRDIDGVGLLTALSVVLTIEDPSRFPHARDVGPYLGFTPIVRQSSETEFRGRCTKRGDARTRRYLIQAAQSLLRSRRDSALKRWALALAERRGRKKATVALARKLAVVMQHLWLSGETYRPFPNLKEKPAAA